MPRLVRYIPAFLRLVLVLACCIGAADCQADELPTAVDEADAQIAIVDIAEALRQHPTLQRRRSEIAVAAGSAQAAFDRRQVELDKLSQQLGELRRGSPEYAEAIERLNRQTTQLKTEIQQMRAKRAADECRAYFDAYHDVVRATSECLAESDYQLVLRKNDTPIRETDIGAEPDEFERIWLRPEVPAPVIVGAQPDVDITADVIRRVQRAHKQRGKMSRAKSG
jgi:Skp family chaperone for outer membrane proteins